MFCVWGAAYAPPNGGAPARVFLGEWTGNSAGADMIVVDPDSGRQEILGFDGIGRTQNLCPDPYRPVLWMSTDGPFYEIDRVTLKSKVVAQVPYQKLVGSRLRVFVIFQIDTANIAQINIEPSEKDESRVAIREVTQSDDDDVLVG